MKWRIDLGYGKICGRIKHDDQRPYTYQSTNNRLNVRWAFWLRLVYPDGEDHMVSSLKLSFCGCYGVYVYEGVWI